MPFVIHTHVPYALMALNQNFSFTRDVSTCIYKMCCAEERNAFIHIVLPCRFSYTLHVEHKESFYGTLNMGARQLFQSRDNKRKLDELIKIILCLAIKKASNVNNFIFEIRNICGAKMKIFIRNVQIVRRRIRYKQKIPNDTSHESKSSQ